MDEWVLRDELLAWAQRWPVIVIISLAGALAALALAYVWPLPYRANVEISVELNPYRILDDQYLPAFTKAKFRNVDDYKHWQMLQLSIVIQSDKFISETLNRLREIDPSWDSIDEHELRSMLVSEWRNAGFWLLSANADTPTHAAEAVSTWRDVILELTREAISNSQDLFALELSLRSLNDQLTENELRAADLKDLRSLLQDFKSKLILQDQGEVLSNQDRQQLLTLNARLADLLSQEVLNSISIPEQNAPTSEVLDWIEKINPVIDDQILFLQTENIKLEEAISQESSQWAAALEDGQGLAATLTLEDLKNIPPEVKQIKPYGLAALIGSMIGLLLWILAFLVQVTRKGYR